MPTGATSAGRIDLDLGINYKAFNKQLSGIAGNAQGMATSAFKGLGRVIASAFAVKQLFAFGKSAISLASDLDEVQNVVDVTFGEMRAEINRFARDALESFGLSELSAKRFSSTIGAMLKSSGLGGKQMLDMSKGITGLAADMASFYNLNPEEAFNKIRSGISGETEPLKQLGVNMSVANIEAYALTQGIKKKYQAMSQAEQVLMRYNYLLSVTKDAQGDFARTSGSWANQVKLLSEQWKIFKGTMGAGFINMLAPLLQGINMLISKLQIAANYFKAFTELIFGSSKAAGTGASTTQDMASSLGDVGGAAKKAGKDMKNSISAFDELNVIGQAASDSIDGAAGAIGGGVDFGEAATGEIDLGIELDELYEFKKTLYEIGDKVKDISGIFLGTFGPSVKSAFDSIMPSLKGWKDLFFLAFSDISSVGKPFKDWLSNDLTPFVQNTITRMGIIFGGLLDSGLKTFTILRDTSKPIFEWFVTSGLPLLTDFSDGAQQVFMAFFNTAKYIFDTMLSQVISPTMALLSGIVVDTLNIIKDFWYTWGMEIVGGLVLAFENIKMLFNEWWVSFLQPIWTTILGTLKWLWEEHLKGLIEELVKFIGKLVTGVLEIYNKFIAPLVQYLIKTLGPTWSLIFQGIVEVIGVALAVIIDVAKGIIKSLGGIIDFIVGIFTGNWKKAWEGVKDTFGGIFDSIAAIAKGVVNLIISALNTAIRGLNRFSISVPDWVTKLTGISGSWGFSIPEIPKLAEGGLVSGPTLAMVGYNKRANVDPEVVTPLSKLQDMLASSNRDVVEVLLLILDALVNLNPRVEFDMETFIRIVYQRLNGERDRIGPQMIG